MRTQATAEAPVRAGLYARMSRGNERGIDRQLADCRAEAARLGWEIADIYCDDDVSATKTKPRPEFERLIADVRAGRISAVLCWDLDRLTRTPAEVISLLALRDPYGLRIRTAGGQDLLADRLGVQLRGIIAEHEVEQLKKRLRRSLVQRAEAGKPHGRPAYGWTATLAGDGPRRIRAGRDELDPVAAGVIQDSAERLLAGETLWSITRGLNSRGLTTASGGAWTTQQLRTVLLRPRNAGLRDHRGAIVGEGAWPAILTREVWDRVCALLTDPSRSRHRTGGAAPRHLLSLIAECGREGCGGLMVVNSGGRKRAPAYTCRGCFRVTRVQHGVDLLVETAMIARLQRPDVLQRLAERAGDPEAVQVAEARIATAEARADTAADSFAEGRITARQLERISVRLEREVAEARAALSAALPSGLDLSGLAGPDAEQRWQRASLDTRREAVRALLRVTVLPEPPKGRAPFNPDSVRLDWL